MNAIFNIDRFWKLEKRNFFHSRMHFVYILGGIVGLYLLSMLMKVWISEGIPTLVYLAMYLVIVAGPCLFEKSVNKHRSIFDFILPTSTFEKFLSIWLKYVIIIPVFLLVIILLLNLVTGLIPVEGIKEHAKEMALSAGLFRYKIIFLLLAVQATFLGGYFYFKKYAFAKTSLLILILFVLLMVVGMIVGYYLFSTSEMSFSFTGDTSDKNATSFSYNIGLSIGTIFNNPLIKTLDIICDIVFVSGMWVVSFFKLRETEI